MKNKYPLVSIIMANWNGGEVYEKCLISLSKMDYPSWELIVVDNGSEDGTTELSLDPKFRIKNSILIKNKTNVGFAPANNQGLTKARGKYLLLLNNDTLVNSNFLNIMVKKMEEDVTIGVIQPKIRMMDTPEYLDNAGSFLTRIGFLHHWGFAKKDTKEFDKEREVFATKGACMLIRKSILKDTLGLFDDSFMSYFEETDFCWRVWLMGHRVIYYPKTEIRHKVGYTIKRLDVGNLNYHYYKNRICSLIKNLSLLSLIYMLPIHLIVSTSIFVIFLIRGSGKKSFLIVKAICWNALNLINIFKKRKQIQSRRILKDRNLFKKLLVPINWKSFLNDFKRVEKDINKA